MALTAQQSADVTPSALLHGVALHSRSALPCTERRVLRGQAVYRMGDSFRHLYLIESGSFKTTTLHENGDEQIFDFHLQNDTIGAEGLALGQYAASAVALEDSCVASLAPHPRENAKQVMQAISSQMARFHASRLMFCRCSADRRIAAFLADLSQRYEMLGYSPLRFKLRMTRREIGEYTGLALETVSRAFGSLQGLGLIEVARSSVRIRDVGMLSRLARGEVTMSEPQDPATDRAHASSGDTPSARHAYLAAGLLAALRGGEPH